MREYFNKETHKLLSITSFGLALGCGLAAYAFSPKESCDRCGYDRPRGGERLFTLACGAWVGAGVAYASNVFEIRKQEREEEELYRITEERRHGSENH